MRKITTLALICFMASTHSTLANDLSSATGHNLDTRVASFDKDEDSVTMSMMIPQTSGTEVPPALAPSAPAPVPAEHTFEDSAVAIEIDKSTQIATIKMPQYPNPIRVYVSTSGSMKIPPAANRLEDGAQAECADNKTPNYTNRWVPARSYVDGGNKLSAKYTTFKLYDSNKYEASMPFAIRLDREGDDPSFRGLFLHQAPAGTEGDLGLNVSGGCVRLPESVVHPKLGRIRVAEELWRATNKEGGISVTIKGENPQVEPEIKIINGRKEVIYPKNYCDDNMVRAKNRELARLRQERDDDLGRKIANFFGFGSDDEKRPTRPDRTTGGVQ